MHSERFHIYFLRNVNYLPWADASHLSPVQSSHDFWFHFSQRGLHFSTRCFTVSQTQEAQCCLLIPSHQGNFPFFFLGSYCASHSGLMLWGLFPIQSMTKCSLIFPHQWPLCSSLPSHFCHPSLALMVSFLACKETLLVVLGLSQSIHPPYQCFLNTIFHISPMLTHFPWSSTFYRIREVKCLERWKGD